MLLKKNGPGGTIKCSEFDLYDCYRKKEFEMKGVPFLAVICAAVLLSGCSRPKEGGAAKKAVEDAAGMTTLKQGEMMKKKLQEFEKSQQEHQKEIEGIE